LLIEHDDIYTLVSVTRSELSSLKEELYRVSSKLDKLASVSH
jgi:hypothetical protein